MAGRPPKPTAIKRAQGNPGKRALKDEPTAPALGAEDVPGWLTRPAKKVWGELAPVLVEMQVLTRADAVAFGNLCELVAHFRRGCKRGEPSNKLAGEIRQHMGRFGMTPADRARLTVVPKKEQDPFEDFDGLRVVDGGKS